MPKHWMHGHAGAYAANWLVVAGVAPVRRGDDLPRARLLAPRRAGAPGSRSSGPASCSPRATASCRRFRSLRSSASASPGCAHGWTASTRGCSCTARSTASRSRACSGTERRATRCSGRTGCSREALGPRRLGVVGARDADEPLRRRETTIQPSPCSSAGCGAIRSQSEQPAISTASPFRRSAPRRLSAPVRRVAPPKPVPSKEPSILPISDGRLADLELRPRAATASGSTIVKRVALGIAHPEHRRHGIAPARDLRIDVGTCGDERGVIGLDVAGGEHDPGLRRRRPSSPPSAA